MIFLSTHDSQFRAAIAHFSSYWKRFDVKTIDSFQKKLRSDAWGILKPLATLFPEERFCQFDYPTSPQIAENATLGEYVILVTTHVQPALRAGELSAGFRTLEHLMELEYAANLHQTFATGGQLGSDVKYVPSHTVFIQALLLALPEWLLQKRWSLICDGLKTIYILNTARPGWKRAIYLECIIALLEALPAATFEWMIEACWNWEFPGSRLITYVGLKGVIRFMILYLLRLALV